MLNVSIKKSDAFGIISSTLCMIHCIATPFFFFATVCSDSCCSAAPEWWKSIDYFFLLVSFFAVIHSTKKTNFKLIKYGLWISWVGLFLYLLNARYEFLYISENIKFIPAFSLIGFHLYNIRYCQCSSNECC